MEGAATKPGRFAIALAGFQAGMVAVLWMLAWMGVSSVWQRRTFWTPENLLATVFHRAELLRGGFASATLSGLALYFVAYSSLGLLFAALFRLKLPGRTLLLAGILWSLTWYFLSFHLIWKTFNPLVLLLHSERPTILGHIIYGAVLARFPHYLPKATVAPAPEPQPVQAEVSDS